MFMDRAYQILLLLQFNKKKMWKINPRWITQNLIFICRWCLFLWIFFYNLKEFFNCVEIKKIITDFTFLPFKRKFLSFINNTALLKTSVLRSEHFSLSLNTILKKKWPKFYHILAKTDTFSRFLFPFDYATFSCLISLLIWLVCVI